jgi:hypothetical protein
LASTWCTANLGPDLSDCLPIRLRKWQGLLLLPAVVISTFQHRASLAQDGTPVGDPPAEQGSYLANLPSIFQLPDAKDRVGWRLLAEYGAVFVAQGGVTPPPVIVFPDEASLVDFQATLARKRVIIGGIPIEVQTAAMEAFEAAQKDATKRKLKITPLGRDAAKRSYQQTVRIWRRRVAPSLEHWVRQKRLTRKEATRLRSLPPSEQGAEILRLEDQGLYFGRNRSRSILSAVAPPGSSQHLSLLALDVAEHFNPTVRAILARHGWVQTVVSDLPHFTYLGVPEKDLPSLGLRKVAKGNRTFWVPDIPPSMLPAPE